MHAHRRHRKESPKPQHRRPSDSSIASVNATATTTTNATTNATAVAGGGAGSLSTGGGGGGGGGLYSYFATARRRWSNTIPYRREKKEDTLLPTTYSSTHHQQQQQKQHQQHNHNHNNHNSSRRSPLNLNLNPTTKNCNNFLMGGHYYPGKDKKRRHMMMRRKTLWYRLFLSSPGRRILTALVVLYALVWHALVPLGGWLWHVDLLTNYIRKNTPNSNSNSNNDWLQFDATLKVPSLHDEQNGREQLASERARSQFGSDPSSQQHKTLRMQLLQEIVPAWYARNNYNNNNNNNDHGAKLPQEKDEAAPKKKPNIDNHNKSTVAKENSLNNSNSNATTTKEQESIRNLKQQQQQQQQQDTITHDIIQNTTAARNSNRVLRVTGDRVAVRTLQNMDDWVTLNHSSCPAIAAMGAEESNNNTTTTTNTNTNTNTITLVVQTSMDRVWILKETCTRWTDPIVAVVFVPNDKQEQQDQQQQEQNYEDLLQACSNVRILHYLASDQESREKADYPVNRLRNMGLDAVTTSHILVMDVDFVPSFHLASTIRTALQLQQQQQQQQQQSNDNSKHALIVPAFERLPPTPCDTDIECAAYLQTNSSFIPSSFADLRTCMNTKDCIIFQSQVNWEGHFSTHSDAWLARKWYQDEPKNQTVKTIPCFHTARYEPYVVLRWCPSSSDDIDIDIDVDVDADADADADSISNHHNKPLAPYYDERFHGYGKNKIELISHLRKSGYHFGVLPEGFIVHNPHPESSVKQTWNDRDGSNLHLSMDKLYYGFLKELDTKYETVHNSSVKLCKQQQ